MVVYMIIATANTYTYIDVYIDKCIRIAICGSSHKRKQICLVTFVACLQDPADGDSDLGKMRGLWRTHVQAWQALSASTCLLWTLCRR